jgi:aldose 1-epimerase
MNEMDTITASALPVSKNRETGFRDHAFYMLRNTAGVTVLLTNYGARVVSIVTPDRNGNLADITLGFTSASEYRFANERYYGATVGRVANRIAGGYFLLDGMPVQLAQNSGVNALHGGKDGFHAVIWTCRKSAENEVVFAYTAADGEEGYPGSLSVQVTYTLSNDNALRITYQALSDSKTVVNLSNHTYFNLSGAASGSVASQLITLNADHFTPLNASMLPTGEIVPVSGTPLDFRMYKEMGTDWDSGHPQIQIAGGYDHNFVLNKSGTKGMEWAARVFDRKSGRILQVETTEPGMQFYTGNYLDGSDIGREGVPYMRRSGFCLETQHFPDAPNHPHFPSIVLQAGETFASTTIYRFMVA